MDESRVDVGQLLRRDPQAWTALLAKEQGLEDVVVTAVTGQPIQRKLAPGDDSPRVTRYLLVLANHSDPISFIGKETTAVEAAFYRDLAPKLPSLAPTCYLSHIRDDRGWIILDDVPNNVSRGRWSAEDVEDVVDDIVFMQASHWDVDSDFRSHYSWLPHLIDRETVSYTWPQLRSELGPYFDEGPAAMISDHALRHLGRLAPRFVEAANGLRVMRALGGWPGVFGESHLAAVADLLDDPVPLLEPLNRMPQTLLHGDMHIYHWHITLFEERRLLDWEKVTTGPGIYDLVSFLERFDLLISDDEAQIYARSDTPVDEETIIDSYMLAMKGRLGARFDARAMRQALPAARCLQVIVNWFPHFAGWFDKMPDFYTWQRVNRSGGDEAANLSIRPFLVYRPFLRRVFRRFLQSYRML